jgi:S-adenosylmethionine decarboxylase
MDSLVKGVQSETVVAHLDKSHICVHTYPETHPDNGISTFRADIEVSTCGEISPLNALNFLLQSFEADVVTVDYRVRGFTRDIDGTKHWVDHDMKSIQDYINPDLLKDYNCVDTNLSSERLYHTKMRWTDMDLDRYVFGGKPVNEQFTTEQRTDITHRLQTEIQEIFYCHNIW